MSAEEEPIRTQNRYFVANSRRRTRQKLSKISGRHSRLFWNAKLREERLAREGKGKKQRRRLPELKD